MSATSAPPTHLLPYTAVAGSRQLLPHRRADWPALLDRQDTLHDNTMVLRAALDAANGKPDRLLARSLRSHISAIGPVATREIDRIGRLVEKVMDGNLWGPLGSKEWVAVDGDGSGAGKSQAVTTVALRITRDAWATHGRSIGPDGNDHVPVGYIEVSSSHRTLGLMQAIYDFFGFPRLASETATTLLRRLGDQLDQVGCRVLIIDDAHQLRQVGRETRQLTDFLKNVLTGLPVTIVGVGNQLKGSALLKASDDDAYIAADQLTARHRRLIFPVYDKARPADLDHVRRVLRQLLDEIVVPNPDCLSSVLADDVLGHLLDGSKGRLGTTIDWVKRAAAETIDKPRQVDIGALDKVRR